MEKCSEVCIKKELGDDENKQGSMINIDYLYRMVNVDIKSTHKL